MKKILGLAIAALIIMATVGFGSWAYFNDTETSSNNQLAAGTLDLNINAGNTNYNIMTGLVNKQPGDSGSAYATMKNVGSLAGTHDIQTSAVTNTGGSGGTEFEDGVGNLGAVARIAPWLDLNENGVFDVGSDIALASAGTFTTAGLQYDVVNNFASKTWTSVLPTVSANQQWRFYLAWDIPTGAGNNIQGDSYTLGFTLILKQPGS
jgi:predicted ribosomally synthesized peptide with SipW-like signal peptide